jgi:hypothetical protein
VMRLTVAFRVVQALSIAVKRGTVGSGRALGSGGYNVARFTHYRCHCEGNPPLALGLGGLGAKSVIQEGRIRPICVFGQCVKS